MMAGFNVQKFSKGLGVDEATFTLAPHFSPLYMPTISHAGAIETRHE
jgi:hypothetical protein